MEQNEWVHGLVKIGEKTLTDIVNGLLMKQYPLPVLDRVESIADRFNQGFHQALLIFNIPTREEIDHICTKVDSLNTKLANITKKVDCLMEGDMGAS